MPRSRRGQVIFNLVVLTVILVLPRIAEASQPVVGMLQTITAEGVVAGWAVDPDTPSASVFVHFYLDGPAGIGRFIGFIAANTLRTDLIYPGSHGFQFSIPSLYRDNHSHTLTVYGIDTSGIDAENIVLPGSPQTFVLNPTGSLETITNDGTAIGWAVDPDATATSIAVHFYLDGPAGIGQFIGLVAANTPRSDLIYPGSHGFQFSIPSQYRDGQSHALSAYAIDTSGIDADNVVLPGSPQTFRWNPIVVHQPVTGLLETMTNDGVALGWALDPDTLATSIAVDFYLDGPAGIGQFIGAVSANTPRSDLIYPGSHGFQFSIPSQYRDGQSHTLNAYGIDTSGIDADNVVLPGSPQTFRWNPIVVHQPVTGLLETITTDGVAAGWGVDPDATATSIAIHFYVDGPAGIGQFIGAVSANTPRSDLIYPGSHGFQFSIPSQYRDGQSHTLNAYGIDTSGIVADNVVLPGSPQTFRLNSNVGSFETITDDGMAIGWAVDPAASTTSIAVHFYLDGPAGIGRFIGAISADIPRIDLTDTGPHGFRFSIPSQYRDGLRHTLTAYSIATSGIGAKNLALPGGPRTFTLNSTVVRMDNGFIRVGLEPRCGGALVELWSQGQNLVNNFDCTGRQVQAALYDGNQNYDNCAGCSGVWGWNPVQGGDKYNFGSPLISMSMDSNSAYLVTRPYEWNPDNKGGGPGRPVLSDVMIEQWLSFVQESPYAVRLHYRITHLGSDTHAGAGQEVPAVYVNRGYDNFIYYSGANPWVNGPATSDLLPLAPQPASIRYAPENWAALVNDAGVGLSVYIPQQYPYVAGVQFAGTSGEYGSGANYFRPYVPFTFGPGSVLAGDVYLFAGDYRDARRTIYALRETAIAADVLPPFGIMDSPAANQTVRRNIPINGWAFDNTRVARVDVLVDGNLDGSAVYGSPREDVALVYPHAPSDIGFQYTLNTMRYANGSHYVSVRAIDAVGNASLFRGAWISFNN